LLMLLRRALPDADNFLSITAKNVQWRAKVPYGVRKPPSS
jgi:hypothetical protein